MGGNGASDSATGPGHAVNVCSTTHDETMCSIAAGGIHTTVKGASSQSVGAARVELVAGTRAETCAADKTEKAVGLVVISKRDGGAGRTTMVGGAKAMFVGAFHKLDASGAIVFKCGGSEVVTSEK